MQRLCAALLLIAVLTGCDSTLTIDFGNVPTIDLQQGHLIYAYPGYQVEMPTVNLEQAFQQENWRGPQREGSCVHASMIMLFRWQGREDLADKWLRTYSDGEWAENLAAKFDAEGVQYAYTQGQYDVSFLEWACNTRRGCGVTVKGGVHMVNLVHLDAKWAGLLDNNDIGEIKWVPRETFLSEWFNSDSWAVTPVYTPPPPLPFS